VPPVRQPGVRQLLQGAAPARAPGRSVRAAHDGRRRPLEPVGGSGRTEPRAASADARARRLAGRSRSRARSSGTSARARVSCRKTLTSARRSCNGCSFEQYDHEPAIAVARFWLAYSGRPDEFADRLPERTAAGHRALAAMERHLDGREFLVGDGLTLADIALYAYSHVADEGGFRPGAIPRAARVARASGFRAWTRHNRRVVQIRAAVSKNSVLAGGPGARPRRAEDG